MNDRKLLEIVTDYFLNSRDFNGYPLYLMGPSNAETRESLRTTTTQLVREGDLVIRTNRHVNPHIRGFAKDEVERMLADLSTADLEDVVLYPSARFLEGVLTDGRFADRPYTRQLALGAGQLDFRTFDVAVLEWYRNDPRYEYRTNDWGGSINIRDEYFQTNDVLDRDQIELKTFGFAYDHAMNRAVAVYCVYLAGLSPEHQQVWKARELAGRYQLHPDYFRTSIMGDWPERLSMFEAFTMELCVINQMAAAMGRPSLFREDFSGVRRPKTFGWLVRPTEASFNEFVLTLDKMMSDNLNKKFLEEDVPSETEMTRKDGKIVVQARGTIAMLEDWIKIRFKSSSSKPIEDMISAFKNVRKARQQPAHALKPDTFDNSLPHKQRELMIQAYGAVRTLREALSLHPAVASANIDVSPDLSEGRIWTW